MRSDIVGQSGSNAGDICGIHHAQRQRHSIGRLAGSVVGAVGGIEKGRVESGADVRRELIPSCDISRIAEHLRNLGHRNSVGIIDRRAGKCP